MRPCRAPVVCLAQGAPLGSEPAARQPEQYALGSGASQIPGGARNGPARSRQCPGGDSQRGPCMDAQNWHWCRAAKSSVIDSAPVCNDISGPVAALAPTCGQSG